MTAGLSGCYGFSSPLLRSVFLSCARQCIDIRLEQLAVCHKKRCDGSQKAEPLAFSIRDPKERSLYFDHPVIGLLVVTTHGEDYAG